MCDKRENVFVLRKTFICLLGLSLLFYGHVTDSVAENEEPITI